MSAINSALASPPAPRAAPTADINGRAVGKQAKAAIETARADGAELPKNIQGRVASSIARGIDPASLFKALATPPADAPAGDAPVEEPADPVVADSPDIVATTAETALTALLPADRYPVYAPAALT